MRTTAIRQGETIRGDRIVYRAGKVTRARTGARTEVALGRNVDAAVLIPLALTSAGGQPPSGFIRLEARSARGACDKHEPDRAKTSTGGHTAHTGRMRGAAELVVAIPHPGQR